MIDFDKSIFENRRQLNRPFLAAHRGVSGANVPCNTILSFKTAIEQGADVVEIDVSKSRDGAYFVFHPGMEHRYIGEGVRLEELSAREIERIPLLNADGVPTHYRIPALQEVFALLKGKAYINVDKFWTDIRGITAEIRRAGVEKQVIVKTPVEDTYFAETETYAPDLMYMSVARDRDDVTDRLLGRNIRFIGTEALFTTEQDEIASAAYIRSMHARKLLVWANAIVYDEKDVISANLTDDLSLEKGVAAGWGKLIDCGFDFIQTDWLLPLKIYLQTRQTK